MSPEDAHPVFVPPRRRRIYESIVEQIDQAILTGALKPDTRLPSERELIAQFGVSRATIREALRVLQSRGLICVRHGDPAGARVIADTGAGVRTLIDSLYRAARIELVDVVQLRMIIEGAAATLATAAPAPAIAAIRAAYEDIAAADNPEELKQRDILFHRRVAEATGNPLIVVIVAELHRFNSIAIGLSKLPFLEARRATLAVHGEILEAIERGDAADAAQLAQTHLRHTYSPEIPPTQRGRLAIGQRSKETTP